MRWTATLKAEARTLAWTPRIAEGRRYKRVRRLLVGSTDAEHGMDAPVWKTRMCLRWVAWFPEPPEERHVLFGYLLTSSSLFDARKRFRRPWTVS